MRGDVRNAGRVKKKVRYMHTISLAGAIIPCAGILTTGSASVPDVIRCAVIAHTKAPAILWNGPEKLGVRIGIPFLD